MPQPRGTLAQPAWSISAVALTGGSSQRQNEGSGRQWPTSGSARPCRAACLSILMMDSQSLYRARQAQEWPWSPRPPPTSSHTKILDILAVPRISCLLTLPGLCTRSHLCKPPSTGLCTPAPTPRPLHTPLASTHTCTHAHTHSPRPLHTPPRL